jgi:hypothetical protein
VLPCPYKELQTKFEVRYNILDQEQSLVGPKSVMLPRGIAVVDFMNRINQMHEMERKAIAESFAEQSFPHLTVGYCSLTQAVRLFLL